MSFVGRHELPRVLVVVVCGKSTTNGVVGNTAHHHAYTTSDHDAISISIYTTILQLIVKIVIYIYGGMDV